MKKIIVFLFYFLLFIPRVEALDVNYDISNYYINADVQTNGDLQVTEVIVLDGTFNGYIRDISFKNANLNANTYENNTIYNASNLQMVSIEAAYVDNIDFDIVNQSGFTTLKPSLAQNGGYVSNEITNGESYKMYFRSNNQKVAFRLSYILKDVVVLHQDVAELYWTFIGEEYEDDLSDVQIKINLPDLDNSSNFRIWAHGDLAGEIHSFDNKYALAKINKLDAYNSIDIRMTFDPSIINSQLVSKKTNNYALDNILTVEESRAEKANQERLAMKHKYNFILYTTILWYIALIAFGIYVYFKYDKEYKSTFIHKYNREFIDDYNVEVIDYLFHKSVTPNALTASIMNLIYKKNIRLEQIPSDKKKKEYRFYLENENNINETEKYLLDFLFTRVGTNNQFTTEDLHKYAKQMKTCEDFSKSYTNWKTRVLYDGKKENFFESHIKASILGVIVFSSSIFLNFIKTILNVQNNITIYTLLLGFIFMLYTIIFNKRTKKGNEHYLKWKAFKNFLNDFGTFETKELPEVILWERYMVYATIFGLAEKVSKVMNVKINELESSGVYVGNTPTFTDFYVYNSLNNDIHRAFEQNTSAITSMHANSSSSSGSGFGGGFSSGGGFGGGGGGGRGF